MVQIGGQRGLVVGETISHYRVLRKLGEGGMGEVYLAEDTRLDRRVALKFLPESLLHDDIARKRLIREAKSAAALDHPFICSIHEVSQGESRPDFIVMEYVEGQTLKERLECGPLSLRDVLLAGAEIAEALEAAHEKDIVHRDIKPANIMLTKKGHAKVMDFGLAKKVRMSSDGQQENGSTLTMNSALTLQGAALGTLAYMSPEQIKADHVDQRSDIFSFGIVLYEMLTGTHPFRRGNAALTTSAILKDAPAVLTRYVQEVPDLLQQTVRKMLAKSPELRYQSVHEVRTNLREQLEAERREIDLGKGPSIAVLPFANLSADLEQEYFSDGLTEELLNALTRIDGLRVAARTSSFHFKGKTEDVRQIGTALNVSHVLEGSVRKAGDRLRITAQLVDVADGYHLWSDRYDSSMQDVFEIQDEITMMIVGSLRVQLLREEGRAVTRRHTEDVEAYNLYSKGRYYWNKMSTEAFETAIGYFERAIALDPNYALAYAGLADSYAGLGDAGLSAIPPEEAFSNAMAAVRKALELDEGLAEAHVSLGHVKMHRFEWKEAEREFKRAIELQPNHAVAYHMSGFFYSLMEQHEEAIGCLRRALELDPVSLGIITDLGVLFYFSRQYDRAIEQYRKVLAMDPSFVRAYVTLCSTYGQLGMYEDAIEMAQKAMDLSGDPSKVAVLGRVYALAGREAEALEVIEDLRALATQRYVSPYCVALIYAGLDDRDRAIDWLRAAVDERVSELIYMKVDPYLDGLRSDPRFTDLLRRVKLAP